MVEGVGQVKNPFPWFDVLLVVAYIGMLTFSIVMEDALMAAIWGVATGLGTHRLVEELFYYRVKRRALR